VAKDRKSLRSGWFSVGAPDYLAAAGRCHQGTAVGKFVPPGEGLFALHPLEDILADSRPATDSRANARRCEDRRGLLFPKRTRRCWRGCRGGRRSLPRNQVCMTQHMTRS